MSAGQRIAIIEDPHLEKARIPSIPRIVIADDHDIVREGIRRILTRMRPNWEICGEAGNGEDSVKLVTALSPDIAVLDITMPRMTGLEATREIMRSNPACRVLIFTVHDSEWLKSEIRRTGAHGYVQKSQVARDLVSAIECLLAGGTFFADQAGTDLDAGSDGPGRKPGEQ